MAINETVLTSLLTILINGIITGFAVFLGTHAGQRLINKGYISNYERMIDNLKEIKEIIEKPKVDKVEQKELVEQIEENIQPKETENAKQTE